MSSRSAAASSWRSGTCSRPSRCAANARVGVPLSSRSQKPACRDDIQLAVGIVGRQWRPVLSCDPEPLTVASFWATWKSIVQGRSARVIVCSASSSASLVLPVEVLGQDGDLQARCSPS